MSGNGKTLVALDTMERSPYGTAYSSRSARNEVGVMYISNDGGATWANCTPPAVNTTFRDVAISKDGRHLVVVELPNYAVTGYVWTSNNAGKDWTRQDSAGSARWDKVAMSRDGRFIVASSAVVNFLNEGDGQLITSSNSGRTWTQRRDRNRRDDLSCDSTCTTLLYISGGRAGGGFVDASYDAGASFQNAWVTVQQFEPSGASIAMSTC
jgi:photosystem II stability/assembly factor-like uncharacterized protein